ncbi:metallophosphoesterase [Neobacillus citreus]|uniref:Metallophosphoesterase n=1 Tax=Neobacillus citreus TaxID=2833578 RepID=A0A942SWE4_9BACI|nr:metallophosphoesterase [Neobacillus citreus]MCH6265711.1 metallophosphoesterase [Neobacillus citreus]
MFQNLTRRTFIKRTFGSLLTVLGMGAGGYYYANRIEPSLLEIKQLEIIHERIPSSFNGKKIVQFSDTHLGFQYTLDKFTGLVDTINDLQPDIIVFTGDLMDEPNKYLKTNQLAPILKKLHAPLGKYCIYGNHDHGGYGSEIYREIMNTAGFTILLNSAVSVTLEDNSFISLLGIDDRMLGRPDITTAIKNVPNNCFKILLSHAPDMADTASSYPIDWQLSGHSHGGQVKLPFIGALVIPPFAKIYQEGHYIVCGGHELNLYVNRGIGTTRLPFRFMAKPELTVFTLKS